ncbi:MAG: T9SS type A sorting domain-containing protein [Candidatus Krumholzibacteria bacterium]|nr:T9SS type A sorting domain-containing protein [Candidatus Krumholzibacteria bacterium]
MSYLRAILAATLLLAIPAITSGAEPSTSPLPPDKALVTDGHVSHNLGNLANHVTNWGLIGSQPTRPSTYSHAPSATWPAGTDDLYLYSAGLWIGGTVLGERLVSTAQYTTEILASPAAGDTIFSTSRGTPGGRRYPWTGADDDDDGFEDEDPLDGTDNDNDGRIDEDYGAIGDQEFVCTMYDNTLMAVQNYPDHTPLNVSVVQRSFQWADPLAADFIGYEYIVTNIGVTNIEQVYCGLFSDFDIGRRGEAGIAEDDLAGAWGRNQGLVRTHDGSFVPVNVGYMWDGAASNPLPGYAGWVMCGLQTDAQSGLTADAMYLPTVQIYRGNMSFDQGGDPTNDDERYQVLSSGDWDPNPFVGQTDDYRITLAAPAVATLQPGESVTFRVALVLGAGIEELLTNAGEAVLTAYGRNFDRDGDPANGEEFHVPWLRDTEGPSPVPGPVTGSLTLSAAPNPFNPQVVLSLGVSQPGQASVTVHDLRGHAVRALMSDTQITESAQVVWDGKDNSGRSLASGIYVVRLVVGRETAERRVTLVR